MNIKISKISYFSFNFKFIEKKKVTLNNMICRGGLQDKCCWSRGWSLIGVLEIFQKKGEWGGGGGARQERAGVKIEEGFDAQRKYE